MEKTFENGVVRKTADALDALSITVYSEIANVSISASKTTNLSARLVGDSTSELASNLSVMRHGNLVEVALKNSSCNCFEAPDLILDIQIPQSGISSIFITCPSNSVTIDSSVFVYKIEIKSCSGTINSEASLKVLKAQTEYGKINVSCKARARTHIEAFTVIGDIHISLKDVSSCELTPVSINGQVENTYHPAKDGFKVEGLVYSKESNIVIC